MQPNFDIITHLKWTILLLPITVQWQWIKKHQNTTGHSPTIWETDNIWANVAAQFCQTMILPTDLPLSEFMSQERFSFSVAGYKCSMLQAKEFQAQAMTAKQMQYWKKKFRSTADMVETVNWNAQAKAFSFLPL